MNDENEPPNDKLRQLAERALTTSEHERDLSSLSNHHTATIVHELRIHQIELQMQNEELRRSQATVSSAKMPPSGTPM